MSRKEYTQKNLATHALNALSKEGLTDEAGESRFLSAILKHGLDAFIEIEGIVTERTMTCEPTQILWKSIVKFFEGEETTPTISSIIKYSKDLGYDIFDKKTDKDWLISLFNLPTELSDARILGGQLRKLQIKRELYSVIQLASNNLIEVSPLEPLSKIITTVDGPIEEYLMKLASSNDEGDYLTKDGDIYLENLFANPNSVTGFKSGFPRYDDYIGGSFEPETMHVIVARPKIGKSSFALNVAINLAKSGTHSIIADMEMSQKKWLNRFLSNLTKINIRKFKTSSFNEEEKDKISDAFKIIKNYPIIYINVNGKSLDETMFCIKRLLNKKIGKNAAGKYDALFIYDYLRINDSSEVSDAIKENQALGFQCIKLKNFSIQEKISALTFCQQNRDAADGKSTSTKTVSGSDRVLWLCDSMMALGRKTDDEQNEDRAANREVFSRKLTPMETRDAPEVDEGTYINYKFDGSTAYLKEGPTNAELRTSQPTIRATDTDKQTEF